MRFSLGTRRDRTPRVAFHSAPWETNVMALKVATLGRFSRSAGNYRNSEDFFKRPLDVFGITLSKHVVTQTRKARTQNDGKHLKLQEKTT